jgi:hypothetical protein
MVVRMLAGLQNAVSPADVASTDVKTGLDIFSKILELIYLFAGYLTTL